MGAALARVDVVGEREEVLCVAFVVLERHLQNHLGLFNLDEDGLVEGSLRLIQVLNEGDDPALVAEDLLFLLALVLERDRQPFVQKGQFAEALRENVEAELERLEDLTVRLERDLGSTLFGLAGDHERSRRLSSLVPLLEDLPILPDLQFQPFRQGVHDGNPDPMEAA